MEHPDHPDHPDEKKHLKSFETQMEDDEYNKRYDTYRPRFVGIPDGWFPNTWGNIVKAWALVLSSDALGCCLFALLLYLFFQNTKLLCWIMVGVGVCYASFVIIMIFIGQTMRPALEKKYMAEALAEEAARDKQHMEAEMEKAKENQM